jgi:hypothetical protein
VTGTADRPVVLDHVRVILTPATADGGILFYAQAVDNKFVAVRNSRFEGPGRAGLRFDGPAVDVTVTNNRFYNLTAAAAFARPSGRASKGTFANNTVRQAQFGLQFEAQANEGSYEFKVALNYFSQTGALLTAPAPPPPPPPPPPAAPPPPPGPLPVPGLTSENNLHDAACNPGNPPLASSPTDVALPNPNPDDDATFLRFPPNAFPTVGPNKVRVGAH